MRFKFAIAALLGSKVNASGESMESTIFTEALTEANRYIGPNGQPINLAETEGHARLELTKTNKYNEPMPLDQIML